MIRKLQESGRLNITILLALSSGFCFCLSVLRVVMSGSLRFLFLNWNLFLAFIPWMVCTVLMTNEKYRKNKVILASLLILWSAFFPNAPYVLTDLFHLRLESSIPVWFDLIVILSFAWTALMFGFMSLLDIETILSSFLNKIITVGAVITLLFMGSFGMYIGRFLRWNTWDVVTNPFPVATDIIERFINPLSYPRTWAMTILMGILLNMMFWTLRLMVERKNTVVIK